MRPQLPQPQLTTLTTSPNLDNSFVPSNTTSVMVQTKPSSFLLCLDRANKLTGGEDVHDFFQAMFYTNFQRCVSPSYHRPFSLFSVFSLFICVSSFPGHMIDFTPSNMAAASNQISTNSNSDSSS